MELVLFAGLQGSGKSTLYATRFATTHALVSKDRMRNNPNPERRQRRLIEEHLSAGRSVVVDNTNPTPEVRAPLIELGRRFGARIVGFHVESTVEESRARNAKREGRARVPDVAIFATAKKLVAPKLEEGFDELYRARLTTRGLEVEAIPGAPRT